MAEKTEKKNKKRLLRGVIITLIVLIVLAILAEFVLPRLLSRLQNEPIPYPEDEAEAPEKGDRFPVTGGGSIVFYETSELSEAETKEYALMNRDMAFSRDGETDLITEGNYADYGRAAVFFADFLQTIADGDEEHYPSYFDPAYIRSHPEDRAAAGAREFSEQHLYDIHVGVIEETTDENGVLTGAYELSYRLFHNDGSLRSDMEEAYTRPLVYTLTDRSGTLLITDVKPLYE